MSEMSDLTSLSIRIKSLEEAIKSQRKKNAAVEKENSEIIYLQRKAKDLHYNLSQSLKETVRGNNATPAIDRSSLGMI